MPWKAASINCTATNITRLGDASGNLHTLVVSATRGRHKMIKKDLRESRAQQHSRPIRNSDISKHER